MSKKNCELIIIGDELLAGAVKDVNAAYIADRLLSLGITVSRVTIAPDDPFLLTDAISRGLEHSNLVVTCGGLGPTSDDYTRQVAADIFGRDLYVNKRLLASITKRYASSGRRIDALGRTQAEVPRGAKFIGNPSGAAPGIILADGHKTLVLLPGVPGEVRGIVDKGLMDYLSSILKPGKSPHIALLRTAGVFETELAERISPALSAYPGSKLSYLPLEGGVDLRVCASSVRELAAVSRSLAEILGDDLYATERKSMSRAVGELLIKTESTLAVAESCTGGMLGARIVDVPGSSAYFLGGVISYSDQSKTDLLGVRQELIASKGAVSIEVAAAMAEGARQKLSSTYGIGITGIAGPDGGGRGKPVGLTCIGLASPHTTRTKRAIYPGFRGVIRERSVTASLDLLRREILKSCANARRGK